MLGKYEIVAETSDLTATSTEFLFCLAQILNIRYSLTHIVSLTVTLALFGM